MGILVGIAMMNAKYNAGDESVSIISGAETVADAVHIPAQEFTQGDGLWQGFPANHSDTDDEEHIQLLEQKITELEARVIELEATIKSEPEEASSQTAVDVGNRFSPMLTTDALVKAGLSEAMAADIIRRRNDIELAKLALRDTAVREDYLGTTRYMRELTALVESQITIREELGDEVYDQYLYANKRPNRVKVVSVMLGSSAEQAGIKDGDIVLNYGQDRIFNGLELKNATSEGKLEEYVSMDVLRGGQLMSLWVTRGPLGIRLGTARVAP